VERLEIALRGGKRFTKDLAAKLKDEKELADEERGRRSEGHEHRAGLTVPTPKKSRQPRRRGRQPQYNPHHLDRLLADYDAMGVPIKEFAQRKQMAFSIATQQLHAARARRSRLKRVARTKSRQGKIN
jgi:hypothetical protein